MGGKTISAYCPKKNRLRIFFWEKIEKAKASGSKKNLRNFFLGKS
jgi:hypothetical protein